MMYRFWAALGGFALLTYSTIGYGADIQLEEILRLAEKNDHRISAGEMGLAAAESSVSVARAGYYPKLDFEAVDSTGFPGSSGALGVGGLMGSPYRKGVGVGLVAQANLWDFGRTTYGVRAARHDSHVREEEVRLTQMDADLEATRLYFACVRDRSQSENWSFVLAEAKVVAEEVTKFVKTGQRSVVERFLAESQVEEALTEQADFAQRAKLTLGRLGILTGVNYSAATCPAVEAMSEIAKRFEPGQLKNPILAAAEEKAQAEADRAKQATAGHLPKLVAVASYGALENARLVPKGDYAVGVGVILPLFDGLKTSSEVRRAEALSAERSFLIEAERDRIAQTNAKYDEIIEGAKARLAHLEPELNLAREGFQVARKRYFKFQGLLVDVREALRNLSRTKNQFDETRLDFVEGTVAKAIFNGGRVRGSSLGN